MDIKNMQKADKMYTYINEYVICTYTFYIIFIWQIL